jgi:hypothetical protein
VFDEKESNSHSADLLPKLTKDFLQNANWRPRQKSFACPRISIETKFEDGIAHECKKCAIQLTSL